MSLAIDSPLPDSSGSSSSDHVDDFAGFLDEVLDSDSDSDDDVGSIQGTKRRKVEVNSHGSSAISSTQVLELQKVEKMKNAISLCEHFWVLQRYVSRLWGKWIQAANFMWQKQPEHMFSI
ncbi:hypothetical protein M0R45_023843 [Rubus argutus]|uniref:Uncharacterized protein n=1 Tax=Rubus argutus TaxID=59490 RepID=A0AAW1WTH2_RUBAR